MKWLETCLMIRELGLQLYKPLKLANLNQRWFKLVFFEGITLARD